MAALQYQRRSFPVDSGVKDWGSLPPTFDLATNGLLRFQTVVRWPRHPMLSTRLVTLRMLHCFTHPRQPHLNPVELCLFLIQTPANSPATPDSRLFLNVLGLELNICSTLTHHVPLLIA